MKIPSFRELLEKYVYNFRIILKTSDNVIVSFFFERKILLENQQKLKTTLFTKYIHICTSHYQLLIQTLYIIQNVVFTMVKKTFIKWTAIEESSSTYIRGLSKINANLLGVISSILC